MEERLDDFLEHYHFLTLSPECHWDKSRRLLEALLDSQAFERTWKDLDDEAQNWQGGEGVFLSEILTDFGAIPTAAALAALTTTGRLVTNPDLRAKVHAAAHQWWQRLTSRRWGHGIETGYNRFTIIEWLDQGTVLLERLEEPWVKAYRRYFQEELLNKLRDPERCGPDYISSEIEALLRLDVIGGVIPQDITAQLTTANQRVMDYTNIRLLHAHLLDEDTLGKLSHHRMCSLPTHRFRTQIRDPGVYKPAQEDAVYGQGAIYTMNLLVLREPILDLMKTTDQEFTIPELAQQSCQALPETQAVVGYLLKSGLAIFDPEELPGKPWHDVKRRFRLTRYGAILAALA